MPNEGTASYQRILGHLRRAVTDYHMLSPGDHIAVGVSGGSDSMVLLLGLWRLGQFLGISFKLTAVSVDPQFNGLPANFSPIEELCRELSIPYYIERTVIGELVFQVRREDNPCYLCARMRRGALTLAAERLGCNKLALGHNLDDAVETFVMNLLWEGRIGCFSPFTDYSLPDEGASCGETPRREVPCGKEKELRRIAVIRPLVYTQSKEIRRAARDCGLECFKLPCPNDGKSGRQAAREWIRQQERLYPGVKQRLFGAMVRGNISGW